MLKERRKLLLVARESPLSTVHLRNLYEISKLGGIVMPPMLTYYNHPVTVEGCTEYMVRRILQQFIPAGNEPSGCACTSIWRLPRGLNTPQLCCVTSWIPRQLAAGYLTADEDFYEWEGMQQ